LLVLSSPSGAGKTSLSRELLKRNKNLFLSISYTTRPPRPGEVDKSDYYFIDESKFNEKAFEGKVGGLSMSSTKSSTGHLLGAAGAVEAVFSIMCLRENIIPPTLNLDNPSVKTKIDLVPHESKKKEINSILSNSFGFGGTNASLIFSRYYN